MRLERRFVDRVRRDSGAVAAPAASRIARGQPVDVAGGRQPAGVRR